MCLLALCVAPAVAQPGPLPGPLPLYASEYQAKATFLYNFTKFVDWPPAAADSKEPLIMVVFGRDPFARALEHTVWGKTVSDRRLVVRQVRRLEQLAPCNLLFISAEERKLAPEILKAVEQATVLTVSEMEDFLELGGMVRLVMESNQVRFMVNREAARRKGLTISSKLLSLAGIVKR